MSEARENLTNEAIVYFYYVFLGQLQDEANHNFSVTGFLSKLAKCPICSQWRSIDY